MRLLVVLLALAGAAGLLAPRVEAPAPVQRVERDVGREVRRAREPARAPVLRCPRDAEPGCVAVRGRVVLVESVDPDGDGDLHVVLLAGSVTGPGVTAVDVRPGLRPGRDPRIGDVVSAAGPVQRGTHGQAQIHALRFRAPG